MLVLKLIFKSWFAFPFLVVIIITPLAAREPKIAVDEASFSTVILSISSGLIELKILREPPTPPSFIGTPSITISGLEVKDKEPLPRIRIVCPSPGAPLAEVICTPAILPWMSWSAFTAGALLKSLSVTKFTEPVRSFFFIAPYPMTTTSSNCCVSSWRTMFIVPALAATSRLL